MTLVTGPVPHAVPTAGGDLPAHLWLPHTGAGAQPPGLVVLQEIFGVTDYIKDRCADLARLGYAVLAPEIYWRLDDAQIDESAPDFLDRAMAVVGRLDWDLAVQDGRAALAELADRPGVGPVGVLGFCFGGGLAFNVAAEADPAVLVSYYGSALPSLTGLADQVTCPSLHHFGAEDSFIPAEQVDLIQEAVTAGGARDDVEFRRHEGGGHAFDNPHPAFHHAASSGRAWEQTVDFLTRHLPRPAG